MSALRALLETDTASDPMGRRSVWTGLRLRQISRLLLRASPNTERRLLENLGYSVAQPTDAPPQQVCLTSAHAIGSDNHHIIN